MIPLSAMDSTGSPASIPPVIEEVPVVPAPKTSALARSSAFYESGSPPEQSAKVRTYSGSP